MSQRKRQPQSPINTGIQANEVKADVLAVGPGARATQYGDAAQTRLLNQLTAIDRRLDALSAQLGQPATAGAHPDLRSPDPGQLKALLVANTRRLYGLELRAAQLGVHAPPHVTIEIEDLRNEIARLEQLLASS